MGVALFLALQSLLHLIAARSKIFCRQQLFSVFVFRPFHNFYSQIFVRHSKQKQMTIYGWYICSDVRLAWLLFSFVFFFVCFIFLAVLHALGCVYRLALQWYENVIGVNFRRRCQWSRTTGRGQAICLCLMLCPLLLAMLLLCHCRTQTFVINQVRSYRAVNQWWRIMIVERMKYGKITEADWYSKKLAMSMNEFNP